MTGVSLYEWWIPPETVKRMADAFERCDPEETIRGYEESDIAIRDHSPEEVADLKEFFRVCAKRGLGLVGSF